MQNADINSNIYLLCLLKKKEYDIWQFFLCIYFSFSVI